MNKKAFTIIEMLVVMAIIVVISAITIVNFRKSEASGKLQRSAQLVAQGIRKAQNMAISSAEFGGNVPPGGYGVQLTSTSPNNTSFILFADTDNSWKYNFGEGIETFVLESGIEIYLLETLKNNLTRALDPPPTTISILFVPPNPDTRIDPQTGGAAFADIEIRKKGATCPSQDCRTIRVRKETGQVNIQ